MPNFQFDVCFEQKFRFGPSRYFSRLITAVLLLYTEWGKNLESKCFKTSSLKSESDTEIIASQINFKTAIESYPIVKYWPCRIGMLIMSLF